ncbi:MAG: TetR/AcrR family transcriptional regulator [Rhodobacteraceae bacterium]|nr:TetR/AcrR family transcriptional regulator [Paracoccaceae bacterium]
MQNTPTEPTIASTLPTKSERTRAQILSAAALLFREEGHSAATMRRISQTAGIEAGSIYYHFRSKEDILDAVLEIGLRDLYNSVEGYWKEAKTRGDGVRIVFPEMVDLHLRFLLTQSDFTSANIRTYPVLGEKLRAQHRPLRKAYAALWDEMFTLFQNSGSLRTDMRVVPLRQFILGALNWTVEWYDTAHYPVQELSQRMSKLLLEGMSEELVHGHPIPAPQSTTGEQVGRPRHETAKGKAARSREQVLTAAALTIRENGYKAATMRSIAQAAGSEAGSIYYHFPSKEHILDEVLDLGLRDLLNGVRDAVTDTSAFSDHRSRIAVAMETHLKYLIQASEFTSANIRVYGQLPKDVRARHLPVRHEYARLWDGILSEAQKAGDIRSDIRVVPLRQAMLGALNWTVEWFDLDKSTKDNHYDLRDLTSMLQKLLLDGLLFKS